MTKHVDESTFRLRSEAPNQKHSSRQSFYLSECVSNVFSILLLSSVHTDEGLTLVPENRECAKKGGLCEGKTRC